MTRITITLSDEEKTALLSLSEKEFREPRMQAALIIRESLVQRGLLETAPKNETTVGDKQDGVAELGKEILSTAEQKLSKEAGENNEWN